ncbi:MAG: PAS domain-containing sensor histidine kinase [Hyphomicrobiales bacterium]|nr:PAS domain-containing sensor histidine kinase [Hyphomicrobiales bacterium]
MAGCERLVPPGLIDPLERGRSARFVGTVVAAPFFGVGAFAFASYGRMDAATVAASLCALCGLCWLAALLVAVNVSRQLIEGAALVLAAFFAALVLAASGGLGSPLCAAVFALVFEAWWIGRSRKALIAGMGAALAVFAAQLPLAGIVAPTAGPAVSPWQWLVPLAYGLTAWARLRMVFLDLHTTILANEEPCLEERIDAVTVRIAANGDVTDVSDQASRLFRLAPELLLGTGLFDRIHVADRVAYLCALSDAKEGGDRAGADIRLRIPGQDGRSADYHSYAVEMFRASEGRDVAVLIRDNGEMAALKAELAEAAEQASSNEVAKNRFLAAVSHELRTPLNAILGFSDMLAHEMFGPFADPRQKEYAGLIHESGTHLLSVVNSILDVSKIESGTYPIHPEPFAFADAVEMCHSMMAHQASVKPVSLRVALASGVGEICADRRAVQQILINLVSNAVKFTPAGGSVMIGAKRAGQRLRFWVSDTGIGISSDDLKRLGQPFTQVQNDYTRQFEGTGLGLSLVKGLVVLHEGTMAIESAPGDGTTVTITMPVSGPHAVAPADEAAASEYLSNGAGNGTQRKTA